MDIRAAASKEQKHTAHAYDVCPRVEPCDTATKVWSCSLHCWMSITHRNRHSMLPSTSTNRYLRPNNHTRGTHELHTRPPAASPTAQPNIQLLQASLDAVGQVHRNDLRATLVRFLRKHAFMRGEARHPQHRAHTARTKAAFTHSISPKSQCTKAATSVGLSSSGWQTHEHKQTSKKRCQKRCVTVCHLCPSPTHLGCSDTLRTWTARTVVVAGGNSDGARVQSSCSATPSLLP